MGIKDQLEIELPDGWLLVGYREPLEGEYFLLGGTPFRATLDHSSTEIVVKPEFEWPRNLGDCFLAQDSDGVWRAHLSLPDIDYERSAWRSPCSIRVDQWLEKFQPPTVKHWRLSLTRRAGK